MKAIVSPLGLIAFTAFIFSPVTADAGNCGCYKVLKSCMKKKDVAPDACTDAFETCITECKDKKECINECNEHKKDYKRACRERFKATQCPLKGKEAKACKKKAKREKNTCHRRNKTFARMCKYRCKKQAE